MVETLLAASRFRAYTQIEHFVRCSCCAATKYASQSNNNNNIEHGYEKFKCVCCDASYFFGDYTHVHIDSDVISVYLCVHFFVASTAPIHSENCALCAVFHLDSSNILRLGCITESFFWYAAPFSRILWKSCSNPFAQATVLRNVRMPLYKAGRQQLLPLLSERKATIQPTNKRHYSGKSVCHTGISFLLPLYY